MSTGLAELCPGACALRGRADMEMASALLWGPGRPAGLHFLTFGQTCVPPTSPPAVWPLFLSGVPSLAVSTSPVPACLSGSLAVTSPAQDGLPKEGVCPFLLVEQRAGGEGEGETQRQRRGQGHRDGARDTETQRRGQRHRDTRTERGGDVERYRDTQQGGRTELSLQGEWIWTWECAEEVGL